MNILEFKMRSNTHQTHFEDLILLGKDGIEEMNDKIDKFISSICISSILGSGSVGC